MTEVVLPGEKGSILLSLLLAVAVISVLVGVGASTGWFGEGGLQPVSEDAANEATGGRAYDAVRISDLRQIQTGLEVYYAENGIYPSTDGAKTVLRADAEPCLELVAGGYWESCLRDPTGAYYTYLSDGRTYTLEAELEEEGSQYCEEENGTCVRQLHDGMGTHLFPEDELE
jgi:hypothetical protein